jgi:oligopeptide/dipeptide ABC transporter ATP-binding protein
MMSFVDGVDQETLLEVEDLHVEFRTSDGVANVLNGVSYRVRTGETLAVLGESGSGKSVTAQTIMGILDMPPAVITGGSIRFQGEELLEASPHRRMEIRGDAIAMIFQDALSALNPVFTVGFQIEEQLRVRRGMTRREARKRAIELLDLVRIYAGRIVEQADVNELFRAPGHPYTEALMNSIPRLDLKGQTLKTITGLPPSLLNIPPGCPFHPRCERAEDRCASERPEQHHIGFGRVSACHFAEAVVARA